MNSDLVIRTHWTGDPAEQESLLKHEWLVTNGLGSYASGTISGVPTRRFHSFLTVAHPDPLGRYVMLNQLSELVRFSDGSVQKIGGFEWVGGALELHGMSSLREFRLDSGLPVWRYELAGHVLEKRILMPYMSNTVHIGYRLVSGTGPVRLKIRVAVHFRRHSDPLDEGLPADSYDLKASAGRLEIHGLSIPPLRLYMDGESSAFTIETKRFADILYRIEKQRGYGAQGDLWSPGYFRVDLAAGKDVTFIASAESWESILALSPVEVLQAELERRQRLLAAAHPALHKGLARHLVLAADQFIIAPTERVGETTRIRATGGDVRTVIAGYHWFTDWGRDTMISLEGLALITGRHVEAGHILRTFAYHLRDGLIPNMFPEGESEGVYYTADATLWFFHALDRYIEITGDRDIFNDLLPKLLDIIDHHLQGTRFGIHCDPGDGLLIQGDPRFALTWMDAKLDDWVVTPRRGKAVEINALWYNALRVMEKWMIKENQSSRVSEIAELADAARLSFNQRFWNAQTSYLYDLVDGENGKDDPACRPNQLLALSLPHPVLDKEHWQSVFQNIKERLLTPVGLRTLSPDHPDYKADYHGDLRTRDAAYHQGTVWPWLIGPYLDAWLRVYPEQREEAHDFLNRLLERHLHEACIGSVSEIFDAEGLFTPRGCIAQAWSVAEILRVWVKVAENRKSD
ncbi:MAG: amylo-alpha-1,6-glucosidase [Methylobacter sp.]|nr:amylo-alpha-1,6-glucosidase [Methylobacter sp.]